MSTATVEVVPADLAQLQKAALEGQERLRTTLERDPRTMSVLDRMTLVLDHGAARAVLAYLDALSEAWPVGHER
jgi:hypothetical protein